MNQILQGSDHALDSGLVKLLAEHYHQVDPVIASARIVTGQCSWFVAEKEHIRSKLLIRTLVNRPMIFPTSILFFRQVLKELGIGHGNPAIMFIQKIIIWFKQNDHPRCV